MKSLHQWILASAAALTSLGASAQVTYRLGDSPDFSFELSASSFVTSNTSFAASSLTQCSSVHGACTRVNFVVDAFADGLTSADMNWQAAVIETNAGSDYFYFSKPAFTTVGAHFDQLAGSAASLTVSAVPEPAAFALMALGLIVVGAASKRRKA